MDIKIFKIKKSFKKGGIHVNPDIYWGIFLFMAFLIILASMVFGFYLLKKVNQEITLSEDDKTQVQQVTQEKIDSMLEYFSLRQKKSDEIINSPSPIIDPSL